MQISDREASIVLGATLMHWGVPFRVASKRELSDHEQDLVDQALEKIVAVRDAQPELLLHEIHLSHSEIALLADVVHNCLEECGNDPVELRLELKTGERQEVEAVVAHLQSCLPSADAASRQ